MVLELGLVIVVANDHFDAWHHVKLFEPLVAHFPLSPFLFPFNSLRHYCFFQLQYYYFIRLMGRKASHVALECTLQSHPNMVCFQLQYVVRRLLSRSLRVPSLKKKHLICSWQVILGEEVAASKLTLFDLTKQICDAVQSRAEQGL